MPSQISPTQSRTRRALPRSGRVLVSACVGWLAVLAPALSPAHGQDEADEQLEVVLAALPHIRGTLPEGPAVLDPEGFCTVRLSGWSCPEALRVAADELDLRLHGREFTHICLAGPSTCRLIGAESLVVPSQLEIDGATARLLVELWWQTGNRAHPVKHQRSRLTLVRERGRWRFARREPLPPY